MRIWSLVCLLAFVGIAAAAPIPVRDVWEPVARGASWRQQGRTILSRVLPEAAKAKVRAVNPWNKKISWKQPSPSEDTKRDNGVLHMLGIPDIPARRDNGVLHMEEAPVNDARSLLYGHSQKSAPDTKRDNGVIHMESLPNDNSKRRWKRENGVIHMQAEAEKVERDPENGTIHVYKRDPDNGTIHVNKRDPDNGTIHVNKRDPENGVIQPQSIPGPPDSDTKRDNGVLHMQGVPNADTKRSSKRDNGVIHMQAVPEKVERENGVIHVNKRDPENGTIHVQSIPGPPDSDTKRDNGVLHMQGVPSADTKRGSKRDNGVIHMQAVPENVARDNGVIHLERESKHGSITYLSPDAVHDFDAEGENGVIHLDK